MSAQTRDKVRERYGRIAAGLSGESQGNGCCSPAYGCSNQGITDTSLNYANMELSALPKEAVEASLGCANPLVFAQLQEGEVVLDLGSGGGIDVLFASRLVGDTGKVYGLDMTDEMLKLAQENKTRMGATNVEFLKGYIEDIPLSNESVDAVISNCVINLSEDKEKALAEAYRVTKQGGRLRVADLIALKELDHAIRKSTEMWSSCLAGTITKEEYESLLQQCGYTNIRVEIAHVYTAEILRTEFTGSLGSWTPVLDLESLDGAFAGALISADK